ncbi:hypothetical protein [Streptomyces sp. OP7]|uniref:hypothetical protein n=1 Tax=Streptomyces sp. OP7 TaxID=3142462 RepID=UPI0032E9109E
MGFVVLGVVAGAVVWGAGGGGVGQVGLPGCAGAGDRGFPLTAHVRGGPEAYDAGGGFGGWELELSNTTGRTCTGVHPVVVLVDEERKLKPSQPRLEFYDPAGRPHPVRFEATDADELVGAFADDAERFPGFTVGPRATLTVKVRLAVTSDAVPNHVTATAAVVQRRDGDGDWVGQSDDYRFRIDGAPGRDGFSLAEELAGTGTGPQVLALAAGAVLTGALAVLFARRHRG